MRERERESVGHSRLQGTICKGVSALAESSNNIPLTEGIGCGGAVGTTVGRRSRARYGRTLHVTFATARSGRAAAGEFRNRTNEAVLLLDVFFCGCFVVLS